MSRLEGSALPPPLGVLPVSKDKQVHSRQNQSHLHGLSPVLQEAINICIGVIADVSKPRQVNKFKSF
jgi:hypothetical protein